MNQGKRLQYMDLAKGIGVCLVILGHMPSVVPEPIRMWIFSFHMPLFFIISGYFARIFSDNKELIECIVSKFKRLMLFGYLAFGLAFLIIDALLHNWTQQEVLAEIKVLLLGNTSRIIWFFLSLFIVETLFAIVTRFAKTVLSQFLICLFVVILGYALGCVGWNCYRIGSSLYAYGFYFFGFLAKRYNVFEIGKKKQYFLAIASLLINIFGTIILLKISQMVLDINNNMHHDIAANYMIALGGSYTLLFISMMLCKGNGLLSLKILGYVGMNSFFFFPITNYVPEAFTTLIHNGGTVDKFGSYAVGGVIAWVVSEAATCTKRHKCRKR